MATYDDSYIYDHQPPPSAFSDGSSEHEKSTTTFIKRIFSHASRGRSNDDYESQNGRGLRFAKSMSQLPSQQSPPAFILTPSPNTHPLLAKPRARDEVRPRHKRSFYRQPTPGQTDSVSHARREAERALESRRRESKSSYGRTSTAVSSRGHTPCNSDGTQDLYTRNLRGRERIAMDAALTAQYVREWGFFIKCYAEGRFNMSNPPDPPPRRPDYNHLVAPAPPNEKERLQAVKTCNISLPLSSRQKCQRLVQLACTVFQTRMASISIIDEHHDIIKADYGFGIRYIDRNDSMAPHVLLANEPMVVLDTEQDWRFQGNPLSANEPHIKFYVGAPIVTYEGHTIGVFAVFDTQPRASFPAASRRKLMDFGRLVMTEFEMAMEQQALPPIPKASTMKVFNKVNSGDNVSDDGSVVSRRTKLSSRILKAMEEDAAQKMDEAFPAGEASEVFPQFPTHPAARPIQHQKHIPILIPNYTAIQEDDNLATPPLTPCRPFSISSMTSISSDDSASIEEISPAPTPRNSLVSMCPSTMPDVRSALFMKPSQKTSMSEAALATSLIARSFLYDLVYLLRVTINPASPESPFFPSDLNRQSQNITTRVLVSHGLPDPPPIFDAALHLRALRSLGGVIYENPIKDRNSPQDTVGYQIGILIPLEKYETGGIILAAFSIHERKDFKPEQVEFLKKFGDSMKDILVNADPEPGVGVQSPPWPL
ncbi:hypothetical protein EX30DRAFT_372569 [Ascodesmis nigricans]|uniref:GAF domain-containing protein n=1 Tax=Ascodesmis nigricans TaxID=341454 RepID=A0A4S2MU25_9PEZI|nr:hypothetical protein EX30DRAFT_372569 [Ascodesmis nigricans]